MPGTPIKNEMLAAIEAAGGAPKLLERVANGETLIAIAEDLHVSRQVISGLLNSDENREALRSARREAAGTLAEESIGIADGATPETVQVAKLQVDTRRWMASKWDAPTYGEQQRSPAVVINMAQLHLDALRKIEAQIAQQPTLVSSPKTAD